MSVRTSTSAAILVFLLCSLDVLASPDKVCQGLLSQFSSLASCGFVTERSGHHFYALAYDPGSVLEAQKSGDMAAMRRGLQDVVVAPLTILATEDEYTLASVRILIEDRPFSELNRAQFTDCTAQHGDPVDMLKNKDSARQSAFLACLYKKIFEHKQ